MTGSVPVVLSPSELKTILTLTDRFTWSIARPIVASLGLPTGKGREATNEKILESLLDLKQKDKNKFDDIISRVNYIILGQMVYGEKAIFSLAVDNGIIKALDQRFSFQGNIMTHPVSLSETILDDAQLQSSVKNKPELVNYATSNSQSVIVFSSVRELIVREKIPPSALAQYKQFDEIIAKRKEKRQCFDVCILDHATNNIHILIDTNGNIVGDNVTFAKSNIVRELYDTIGVNFKSNEKDFYPLIEPIFNQNSLPYSNLSYKVYDLAFLTNEGTTHKEKKNVATKDLRDDIFNKEGIKAVGNIGLYRIGIRVDRNNPKLQLADNVELIIPGTLRRHLGGSGCSPVNYAILSKCISKEDFETLTKLIL
ncbi:hypothetical protein [Serratia nematodiphila]|uniref:hypothetical protein n=1 Tax=Serratia nematodiphila TaxID=458197 RepID=UPI0020C8F1A2|nr:hypothetical protein [Serratia nematodiphila]UTO03307.1 hypothetical protein NLX84_09810 [Serratia nematodiphila]